MKKKKTLYIGLGVFALGFGIFAASNIKSFASPFLTKAGVSEGGSYTLTSSNFSNGSGNINIGGETWHYNSASVSGNVVTIEDVMYTTVRSGTSQNEGRRGDGYTRMVFTGLDKTDANGLVVHETDVNGAVTKGSNEVTADVDLTFGGTVASADRRGLHFAQAPNSSFSFTSLTLYYSCTYVAPTINITQDDPSVSVGENIGLTAITSDVFGSDSPAYVWESDDEDVATVAGSGLNATVTGVAAGTANIKVTMTLNEVEYFDTVEVTVSEIPSSVTELKVSSNSNIVSNQVFSWFDTTGTGLTAAQVTAFGISAYELSGIENTIDYNNVQDVAGNVFCVYSPMKNGAVGLTNNFSIRYDFKDSANHIIYRATAYYSEGALAQPIKLTAAAFSVEEGKTIEVTADKAFYFTEGTPTFTFSSSDDTVFTVSSVGSVATISGVAEGSANLQVQMTLNEKVYQIERQITVSEAGVQHLISWYTEGTGNQANHFDGAGVWTWVKYGDMGYDGFAAFSAQKSNMTASYESTPSTTIRIEVISDDNATLKYCRVYLVLGAAYNTGTLTMTIPDANGITCTGTITFESGVATAFNA